MPRTVNDHRSGDNAMTAGNGYDGEELQAFLQSIGTQHDELDKLKANHMAKCKGPRGKIKSTMKSVREAEINLNAFRVELKKFLADRKHQKRVEALEPDDAEAHELIRAALGPYADTPLGQAAVKRGKRGGESADSLAP
jgi:hypothetical protein